MSERAASQHGYAQRKRTLKGTPIIGLAHLLVAMTNTKPYRASWPYGPDRTTPVARVCASLVARRAVQVRARAMFMSRRALRERAVYVQLSRLQILQLGEITEQSLRHVHHIVGVHVPAREKHHSKPAADINIGVPKCFRMYLPVWPINSSSFEGTAFCFR